jgi:transcriptional regulator HilA, main transcriptional regulator of SPI1
VLSPGQRRLLRDGLEVPLIPRYFDLLRLLIERRHEAVHRQEIFDRVWAEVIVSDGALSQAIRTLRRALGDDPRNPLFIRTVSRHGYQFVHPQVVVESDEMPAARPPELSATLVGSAAVDPFEPLIAKLLDRALEDDERRDAAEQLHALGTAEALRRIDGLPGHARARALLRDARWDVPGAGPVPLIGAAGWVRSVAAVLWIRARRAGRLASTRWAAASAGGAIAGTVGGTIGGLTLLLLPQAVASGGIVVALAIVGAVAGAVGAAGVGAGLAAAEAFARSQRTAALIACGAAGGGIAGTVAHALSRLVLHSLFGHDVPGIGGGVEGVALGAAAGLGYGIATAGVSGGGMATPHGPDRIRAAGITGLACAAVALLLALADRHLTAASLDLLADRFFGSSVGLGPIARALGEGELRPLTRTLVSGFEGLLFGSGLVLGLTRRRRWTGT